ncbi:MAG: adenosine deaminase, partial [Pseudomonadota bacterium]
KVERGVGQDGAFQMQVQLDLARKNGIILPACEKVDDLYSYRDLGDFLEVYSAIAQAVVDVDDFRRITYEMLRSSVSSGARYVEFFISPHAHEGIDFAVQFEGIRRGIKDAQTDFGLMSRFSPGINREQGPAAAEVYLDEILKNRCDELVGLGLDYLEAPYPPEPFAEVFARARREGLHATAHCGESGPAQYIQGAMDALKIERIDHGYAVIDDPQLMRRCRDEGIMFTACPTVSINTTRWPDLTDPVHPIRVMKEAGLVVTIHSDDPPMFFTDLRQEYEKAHKQLGFSPADLGCSVLAGLQHSWLDETTKRAWHQEWKREIEGLLRRLAD